MVYNCCYFFSINFNFFSPPLQASPAISAKSAILIDAVTGNIIYEKDAYMQREPASTTKIMTALLALEYGNTERIVVVSKHAAETGEASLNLRAGEELSLNELIHGALIKSGNDAAVVIAEAIAPSEDEFIGLMNLKARMLGAWNTNFCNCNGLPDSHHLTTAYDLAMITRYSLHKAEFAEIVNKKHYTVKWYNSNRSYKIKNTNKLLWNYPQATGVKTGTTVKAGKCLVASARDDKKEVIAVILNSNDRFKDAQKLLEYGLSKLY